MTTAIYSKEDAFKKFKQSKSNVKLFQEDYPSKSSGQAGKSTSNPKRFYVLDPNIIWNKMVTNRRSCFYEFWSDSMKIQFALDLDMKGVSTYQESIEIVKSNICKIRKGIKDYYGYSYPVNKIIVLESDSRYSVKESSKYSYRVIFRGVNFENHLVAKDFYQRVHSDYNIEYSDSSIYNMTCLRLCYSAKYGKNAIMIPIELKINGKPTMTDMNCGLEPYSFWLRTMITHTQSSSPLVTTKQMKTPVSKMKINVELGTAGSLNVNVSNINLEEILFQLPSDYYDDYDKWIKVGMCLSSLDTKDSGSIYFELWDRWSRQSGKYDGKIMIKTWEGFKRPSSVKKLGIGSLIKWCKDEGIVNIFKSKSAFSEIIESYPVKPIELDLNSIPKSRLLELSQEKLVPEIYKPYLNKRLICVQSEKGTGKTSNLFDALFSDDSSSPITPETTMLFVSSRRTFGVKLLGDLQRFGFKLYSDITEPDIYAKRIICQVDSLTRLSRDSYDYVIIDECESLARYITSSHFTKNPKANITVSNLEMRIEDAKKIIVMDADFSDRCFTYYKNILGNDVNLDYQVIINHYKPFKDYTIVSLTYNDWVRKVLEAIEQDKKIVIPMASNNKAKDLKTKIEQDFPDKKILLIHKETDDHEKVKNLLNVNNTWGLYDVVIYTPSVCMGVSYDIPNVFDSIYAYGCENSLGAQEFCQMLHRVREPINKIIYASMNLYKEFDSTEDTMNYESVEQILCSDYYLTHFELHNNLVPIKVKIDKTDGCNERVLHYPYKSDPNYDLFVRNSWENIENKLNFSAVFYGYAKFKEYKMEHFKYEEKDTQIAASMKEIKQTRESAEKEASVQGILDAPDITKEEFVGLLKQKDEYLEDKDVQAINRFRFRNCYKLSETTDLTHELVEEFNTKDKMKWYYNLSNIVATENQTSEEKLDIIKFNIMSDKWINSCYMDFTTRNTYTNHLYALNTIKLCGFDINSLEIQQNQSELDVKVISCINYIDANKKEIAYKFNLKTFNKNIVDLEFKDQLKIVNSIINSQYGLKIKKISKTKKDQAPDQIIYAMIDDKLWDSLPKDNKIEGIELYDETGCVEEKRQYNLALLDFLNDDENKDDEEDILPCEGEDDYTKKNQQSVEELEDC